MAEQSTLLRGIPVSYEPKRENRFFAEFPTDVGIETWKIQQFKAPTYTANVVEIPYFNTQDYVLGKYKWEEMDIVLIDTIGPSTTQEVMEWVRLHSESLTGRQGYAAGYKKNIILKATDPTGIEVEKWTLVECMITGVDFGNFDMGSDEVRMITLTVQPFYCIQNV